MYNDFQKLTWALDGTYYPKDFNRIEEGIGDLETYAKYKELQAQYLGAALVKLRTNQDVKIGVRGDSVMYGYNTDTGGEEGLRKITNTTASDRNPSAYAKTLPRTYLDPTASSDAKCDGLYYYTVHPLSNTPVTGKTAVELTGNSLTALRTEVGPPEVMIQVLNDVFEGHVSYVDRVYSGDCAVSSYLRYDYQTNDTVPVKADIEICNLGINDALASFFGTSYVGVPSEFMKWYTNLIERNLDNGIANIIMTPIVQTTVSTYDTDARTKVDVYEKILYDIGQLYGIPVIDGNQFTHNFDNKLIIDFTHCTCEGNSIIGKRMAAPFIAGDFNGFRPLTDSAWLGVRPQEDSINVRGNACIEYTPKAPTPALLLNNNDLYDTGVNRIDQGLGVYMNYPITANVYTDQGSGSTAGTLNREAGDAVLFAQAPEKNPLWRQADMYARQGYTGTGSEYHQITRTTADKEAYDARYDERMTFLRGKHGYNSTTSAITDGKVTWAFYTDTDGVVVVPSLYLEDGTTVHMELDFNDTIPAQAGKFLDAIVAVTELTDSTRTLLKGYVTAAWRKSGDYEWPETEVLADIKTNLLTQVATNYGLTVTSGSTDDQIVALIKAYYATQKDSQARPDNYFEWLDIDSLTYNETSIYDYREPCTANIVYSNCSTASSTSAAGYYGVRQIRTASTQAVAKALPVIKVTTKGWHTISLSSQHATTEAAGKFIAFGLSFMALNDYKRTIAALPTA